MTNAPANSRWYTLLDRAFWLIWLFFPLLIWMVLRSANDEAALKEQLPNLDPACLAALPQTANFSTAGLWASNGYIVWQLALYAALLFIAHRTVHRCAQGRIFVDDTLKALHAVGMIIIAFPLVDLILINALAFFLVVTGDLPSFTPNFLFDIAPFGVGLLILTMRMVIQHAIALKQDHDLTI
jgi:Protein of unknown function (DUF2975)